MKKSEIEPLLPGIFRRTLDRQGAPNPLDAFLDIMEVLHEPSEDVLAQINLFFNPYRAPDRFAVYLAGWVDFDRLWIDDPGAFTAQNLPPYPVGVGRLRELTASAAYLSKWQGTMKGLLMFLEIATGITGFDVNELTGEAFHIHITAPKEAEAYLELIDRIIQAEKPAYVTYKLDVTTS
jgi:phage tail-like protein